MVARIRNKNVIVICDCIGCKNKPTWRQGFMMKKGLIVIDLCEDHHFILRTKVPKDIPLDEKVLKWLLMQETNSYRIVKYGIITGFADIELMRELDKIDIDFE